VRNADCVWHVKRTNINSSGIGPELFVMADGICIF